MDFKNSKKKLSRHRWDSNLVFFSPADMNFLFLRFKLIMNTYEDYAYSNFTWLQSFSTHIHGPKLK